VAPRARLLLDMLRRGRAHRYGPERSQCADLHLPPGAGPHQVMIAVHGGSWQARYGKIVMRGLANDLVRRGWGVWNIEYRRVGAGGGWPATFEDAAAAVDHLAELAHPALDLDRVSLLGHSAGGHLALWLAGRENLPPGAPGYRDGPPAVRLRRVIAQAGVCDLAGAYARSAHGGAAGALMGGSPEQLAGRYAVGDPICLLPLAIPALLVHGTLDETVSIELTRNYARAAHEAGTQVELVEIPGAAGSHRAHIDPRGRAWAAVTSRLPDTRAARTVGDPAADRESGPLSSL
jgi:acetyl esterase/lipase